MNHKMTFTKPSALAKVARILELLKQPMTAHALAKALPLSKRWVHAYLWHLHAEQRVHVTAWVREIDERERMYPREVWLVGEGVDAPRPPALNPDERKKRAWARLKADEEKHARLVAKRRVMNRIKKRRPEPAVAWILGGQHESQRSL